jgi:hypothetical protein
LEPVGATRPPCVAMISAMRSKVLLVAAAIAIAQGLRAEEIPPAQIIADQVRDQGFPCNKAPTVERDPTYSRPDEPVWILKCDNATYRVRLIPGMAADVVRLDK